MPFYSETAAQGRIRHTNWNLYDTRHVVYDPLGMTDRQLKAGYDRAYADFYSWRNIARGSRNHVDWARSAKHLAYSGGWKRLEPMWDRVIRKKHLRRLRPVLESVLTTVEAIRAPEAQSARFVGRMTTSSPPKTSLSTLR